MKLLLDTNVVVDILKEREEFYEKSSLLAALGRIGEFELWFSVSQATDAFYLISEGGKKCCLETALRQMRDMRHYVRIVPVTESDIDKALDSGWDDFEDACVYFAARKIKADAIITRNQKDFMRSPIKAFDCDELFDYLEREKGVSYAEIPWG